MYRGYFIGALVFFLTLGTASTATAQCPTTASWNDNIQAQLVEDLGEANRQDVTLSLTLDLARRGCIADAKPELIDRLVAIYQDDVRNQHQMLSALILGEFGSERGLGALQRLVADEESETVRKVTQAVLLSSELVASASSTR